MLAVAINEDDNEGVLEDSPSIIDSLEIVFQTLSEGQIENLLKVRKLF